MGQRMDGMSYEERQRCLVALGFGSYGDYLGSELWKEVRRRVYGAKGSDCSLCGKPATALHHNRYSLDDLQGDTLKHIFPVCVPCHEGIEYDAGRKRSLPEVVADFERKRCARPAKQAPRPRDCTHCKRTLPADRFDVAAKVGRLKLVCRDCCAELSKRSSRVQKRRMKKFGRRIWAGENYASRNRWLKKLGFTDYRAYLASELWQHVRARVFAEKGTSCHLCGAAATQAHHSRYHREDLDGSTLQHIDPICNACHDRIEFTEVGKKRTLRGANKAKTAPSPAPSPGA